jgi:hypothetical protein
MIARLSFSGASATTYNTLSTTFTSAGLNIRSALFFGSSPSFVFFGGDLKTFSNI